MTSRERTIAECYEVADLLRRVANNSDAIVRIQYVAAVDVVHSAARLLKDDGVELERLRGAITSAVQDQKEASEKIIRQLLNALDEQDQSFGHTHRPRKRLSADNISMADELDDQVRKAKEAAEMFLRTGGDGQ